MKYIIVIMDGASGLPLEVLKDKTTLEAAVTPLLDSVAKHATIGLTHNVPLNLEPSSSTAITSILGIDPVANYVGRAAIEAAAMGIELAPGEIALRLNTVTVEDSKMKSYACGHISTEESTAIINRLAAQLNDDTFTLYPGKAYRHILVVRTMPELLETQLTPPHDISDKPIAGHEPRGTNAAEKLNDYRARARAILADDPTNAARIAAGELPCTDVWPFWPGEAPGKLDSISERHSISLALSSGVDLLFGLAKLYGAEGLHIEGVTDGPDNDYDKQAAQSLAALESHDAVIIHIESPDEMGHAGNFAGKIEAIEAIDRKVISRVVAYQRQHEDVRVLVLPDHPTPIALKTHTHEPVPFMMWGSGIDPNGGFAFSEKAAANTGLVFDPGYKLLDFFFGTGEH